MISLLIPTRGRVGNMRRVTATAMATADEPEGMEVVFYIDEDDFESLQAASDMEDAGYPVDWVSGERILLSQCWNECYARAKGPYYWHGGDDNAFRTKGWDTLILDGFRRWPDGICFVHGRDGLQNPFRLATHGFLHENWINAVGYFCPPHFSSDYNDTWLTEVADLIGRRVTLPEVYIEHLHPDAGKGELDLTHRERLERGRRDDVAATWARLSYRRAKDAEKLKARMIV